MVSHSYGPPMAEICGSSARGGPSFGGHPNNTKMYYLYIIQSTKRVWRYIGITSDVQKRLAQHNSGKTTSTKPYKPFSLIYTETFLDKTTARKREIYLKKTTQAREEIYNTITN